MKISKGNKLQQSISWAENIIGPIKEINDKSWPSYDFNKVYKLGNAKAEYYLKSFRLIGKYQQEKRAYLEWAIKLGNTAELVAFDDEKMYLLLTVVAGQLVEGNEFAKKELLDIYNQAGKILKGLHTIKIKDDDKLSIQEAYNKRIKAWLPRAKPMVAAKDIDWVESQLSEILPMLSKFERVPCHRDFTSRNWLYDGKKLSLIDFEHSRADFFLSDLERLWASVFLKDADIKESFFDGYGELCSEDIEILKRSSALWALNTISWANEHNDKVFEQYGREALKRLQAAS